MLLRPGTRWLHLPESGISNSFYGHIRVKSGERQWCLVQTGLRELKRFYWQNGVRKGQGWAWSCSECTRRNLFIEFLLSAPVIHNTCLQQVRNPRSSQQIYSMMVIILSSLLIPHNFRHNILIGSNTILNKIQSRWFSKFSVALSFLSINLFLLYCWNALEEFANLKVLLHLWMRFCIILFCFVFPGEAYTFTLSWHHCHWRRGGSVRLWELAFEVLNPCTHSPVSGTSNCLMVTIGHSSLDFTHNKVLKGNPEIIQSITEKMNTEADFIKSGHRDNLGAISLPLLYATQ